MKHLTGLILLGLCLTLAGCQEDLGHSAAAAPDAARAALEREHQSLAVLKQILGQPSGSQEGSGEVAIAVPGGSAEVIGSDKAELPARQATLPEHKARPTLSWTPPATREDGSSLAMGEIRGYRLYYRLRHQERFDAIILQGPDATRYPLTDLPPGAYEFAVSTLDHSGLESRRSEPVAIDLI